MESNYYDWCFFYYPLPLISFEVSSLILLFSVIHIFVINISQKVSGKQATKCFELICENVSQVRAFHWLG